MTLMVVLDDERLARVTGGSADKPFKLPSLRELCANAKEGPARLWEKADEARRNGESLDTIANLLKQREDTKRFYSDVCVREVETDFA